MNMTVLMSLRSAGSCAAALMVTSVPPRLSRAGERASTSPPIVSNTRSARPAKSSSRSVSRAMNSSAPSSIASFRALARPVPITCAPAQRASWTAVDPTAPPAPWMTTVCPLASRPWSNSPCRGVNMIDGPRLRRQVAGFDGDVLGGRSVAELVGQPEHLVTDCHPGGPVAERGDNAGYLVARNDRRPLMTGPAGPDWPVQLVVRDAARGDLDQDVAERGLGIGHIFVDKSADARVFVQADGLHCPSRSLDGVFVSANTTSQAARMSGGTGRRPAVSNRARRVVFGLCRDTSLTTTTEANASAWP